ncbi:unnamed protein product [Eruca vesicaria subsp. sativa]|uniref:Uncharacterized protein n=1 Tax=Eruca vesicaria subsp. sativa TaxID=29727 RepID=A0ABC8M2W5_ERUVS|nr:unnamed protein product [Eruca vesicaria subsp. sativa]
MSSSTSSARSHTRRETLQADFASFMKSTMQRFENQEKYLDDAILDMEKHLQEKTTLMAETVQSSAKETSTLSIQNSLVSQTLDSYVAKTNSLLLNIATATVVLGTMTFIYAKLTT